VYAPRPDATPEAELDALAACYRFILFESRAKEGGAPAAPNDDVKESDGYVAAENHTR
jgi:hypothetical protein